MPAKSHPVTVAALMHGEGYCGRVLLGLHRYAYQGAGWRIRWVQGAWDVRTLRQQGVSAVVAYVVNARDARRLRASGLPAVNVATLASVDTLPRVAPDHARVGLMAAEHLLARGFRHFAFMGWRNVIFSRQRWAAFRDRASAGTLTGSVTELEWEAPDWRERLVRLPRPFALFAASDYLALRASEACRDAGLRVPTDVAIVGVDDTPLYCWLAHPPLSSIATPGEEIGAAAGRLVSDLLAGRPAPVHPVLLPPRGLIARGSSEVMAVDDPDVASAAAFVRDHVGNGINVIDVIRSLPVARRTLEKQFRQHLGCSPLAYIQQVRHERARTLLVDTEWPMPRIAQAAGYPGSVVFSRAFRRMEGMTPSAYRAQFRASA